MILNDLFIESIIEQNKLCNVLQTWIDFLTDLLTELIIE